jgi:hypothetical protein
MNVHLSQNAVEGLLGAPPPVQKAFIKQIDFLVRNLNHPSLRAKKFDKGKGRWQARVNDDWRFLLHHRRRHLPHQRDHLPSQIAFAGGERPPYYPSGPPYHDVRQPWRVNSRFRRVFKKIQLGIGA